MEKPTTTTEPPSPVRRSSRVSAQKQKHDKSDSDALHKEEETKKALDVHKMEDVDEEEQDDGVGEAIDVEQAEEEGAEGHQQLSLHARRRNREKLKEQKEQERKGRLRFKHAKSLEEVHYIVDAPPAYHYSLDGFADSNVEETWEAEELKVDQLKKELNKRGIKRTGNKGDLVDRLAKALESERREKRKIAILKRRNSGFLGDISDNAVDVINSDAEEEEEDDKGVDGEKGGKAKEGDKTQEEEEGEKEKEKGDGYFSLFFQKLEDKTTPEDDVQQQNGHNNTHNNEHNNNSATPGSTNCSVNTTPSSSVNPSPSASPVRPLKGVLKTRVVKMPQEMSVPELREQLIAYGVSGSPLRKRKDELQAMLQGQRAREQKAALITRKRARSAGKK